jgi:hypothetical protein
VAAFVRIGWPLSIGIGDRFPSESVAALPRIPQLLSRELIFEAVRLAKFSEKPTRWEAAFCLYSLEDAVAYQARTDLAKFNVIYRVKLLDEEAPAHRGPLNALDFPPPGGIFVENTENLAAFYWAGHSEGQQELVTHSRLKVLEVCG